MDLSCVGGLVKPAATHGVYCVALQFSPISGTVSTDSAAPGFPVAYVSVSRTELNALGCPTTAVAAVTTYDAAGGSLTDEDFHAIFF